MYFNYVYYFNIYPDKRVKEDFTETTCLIVNKFLDQKGHIVPRYRAHFLINYIYQNRAYTQWVSGNGLDMAYSANQAEQEELVAQFNLNSSYQCWVNPENPQISVLVLRHDWLSTTPLILPTIIMLTVFYYLFTNIAAILAIRRAKKT